MKREDGLTAVWLTVLIAVIVVVIGVVIYYSLGDEGIITKATQDEEEFNKTEVLDELNFTITKKYLGTYKNEVTNGTKIEEVYNSDVVINYLKEQNIIENYKDNENVFYVKVDALKSDIKQGKGENGSDKDVYVISKKEESGEYIVFYVKNENEKIEIGPLQLTPEL